MLHARRRQGISQHFFPSQPSFPGFWLTLDPSSPGFTILSDEGRPSEAALLEPPPPKLTGCCLLLSWWRIQREVGIIWKLWIGASLSDVVVTHLVDNRQSFSENPKSPRNDPKLSQNYKNAPKMVQSGPRNDQRWATPCEDGGKSPKAQNDSKWLELLWLSLVGSNWMKMAQILMKSGTKMNAKLPVYLSAYQYGISPF